MTQYANWKGGTEGVGCAPACLSMWGMTIMAPKWTWKAVNKGTAYPYICVSDCAIGYIWQREAKKCVKIVRSTNALAKFSEASVMCAKDGGRLLSLESCAQFVGLQNDLWTQFPDISDRYWLGYYAEGVTRYTTPTRTTPTEANAIGSAGKKSLLPGGAVNDCSGDKHNKVVVVDGSDSDVSSFSVDNDGFYHELVFAQNQQARLKGHKFEKTDNSVAQSYLCEKDTDWMCQNGSMMFQEHCYTMVEAPASLATADNKCQQMGGKVVEVETRMHMNFLQGWLENTDFTYTHIWLGIAQVGNGNLNYKGYEDTSQAFDFTSTGLDFATSPLSAVPGAKCVAMSKADNHLWVRRSCYDESSYICQTRQLAHQNQIETLYPPLFILSFDESIGIKDYLNHKRPVTESLVAITEDGNDQSNLVGAAHFLGLDSSYVEVDTSSGYETPVEFGISISMWVNVHSMLDGERQWLVDGSGSCTTGAEKDHSFMLFLEKSGNVSSGDNSNFSLADPCLDLISGNGSLGTAPISGSTLKLVAILCNGPSDGTGSCHMFTSPESIGISENTWNYFGFMYDLLNNTGSFVINDTFGYQDIENGLPRVSEYFTYDTKNWLMTDAIKGPIRIGSRKFQPPATAPTGAESLAGKMSCVQMYQGALTPSQMFQQKRCPVVDSHPAKFLNCPFGFQYYRGYCFLLSLKEKDFANAEYDCISRSGRNDKQLL